MPYTNEHFDFGFAIIQSKPDTDTNTTGTQDIFSSPTIPVTFRFPL